jgi:hypothetical protein
VDKFVAALAAVPDGDLMLCDGVAYQADMSAGRVPYDDGYLAKIDAYEGTEIAQAVNAGRCALLARHLKDGASVLDIGAGSGAFVRCARSWGFEAHGFDVIPQAAERLHAAGLYAEGAQVFDAVTMWDVLEHIEDPQDVLATIRKGARLFVSLPVFADLTKIRESRHYRPGEHLWYWTADGFIAWMAKRGFRLLEQSEHETAAGRDSIGAFAFALEQFQTAPCPCGGATYVDSFDWPHKPRTFFVRCEKCRAMSDEAVTDEAEAAGLVIEPAEIPA